MLEYPSNCCTSGPKTSQHASSAHFLSIDLIVLQAPCNRLNGHGFRAELPKSWFDKVCVKERIEE
jgi:hypothetical protein